MKKRSISLLIAIVLLCSLFTGCMQTTAPTDSTEPPKTVSSAEPSAAVSEKPEDNSADKTQPAQETPAVSDAPAAGTVPDNKPDEKKASYCTFSINCSSILSNMDELKPEKRPMVPADGVILSAVKVEISEGESVFDVLQRVCRQYGIQLEATWTLGYNSAYVEGINNLYEFDCGELSGWTYHVNGISPNYGCSSCILKDGDTVQWLYTCRLGADV